MIGLTLIVLSILVIGIWIFVELKRFKHQVVAIVMIALILFAYISFSLVLKSHEIDYKSASGLMKAGGVYLSWLGGLSQNFMSITSHAISLDWEMNETEA